MITKDAKEFRDKFKQTKTLFIGLTDRQANNSAIVALQILIDYCPSGTDGEILEDYFKSIKAELERQIA